MVSPFDLLWNFFILSGLQPQLQQRLLAYQRAQALRALEKRDHTRAITLLHRREKLAFLGSPSAGSSSGDERDIERAILCACALALRRLSRGLAAVRGRYYRAPLNRRSSMIAYLVATVVLGHRRDADWCARWVAVVASRSLPSRNRQERAHHEMNCRTSAATMAGSVLCAKWACPSSTRI